MLNADLSDHPVVVLATPCYGGQVNQAYMLSVCTLLRDAAGGAFTLDLMLLSNDALIPRARSTLVAAFMDLPQAIFSSSIPTLSSHWSSFTACSPSIRISSPGFIR
jgi:hypothetical protein